MIQKLMPTVQEFVVLLRARFPEEFLNEQTASTFKETVVDCLESAFPLRKGPGRPPNSVVTLASELFLRQEKKDWKPIFANPKINTGLLAYVELRKDSEADDSITKFERDENEKLDIRAAKRCLRQAVRSRINRGRRKNKKPKANKLF